MSGLKLYPFGAGATEKVFDKTILGGKGANLCEMSAMGLPVPPGIVIPAAECLVYLNNLSPVMRVAQLEQLANSVISFFEQQVRPSWGYVPLLSVRSGARVSMPGMMDTLLNIGLTPSNYDDWAARLGGPCAADCAGRLSAMYSQVVGQSVPGDLKTQLMGAIAAVFRSWNSERAKAYRKLHNYPDNWGTAVTVQAMVFGNLNDQSCSGVLFTRDPATGENFVTGEFLPKAQGEDVVSGVRTPRPLHVMEDWNNAALEELLNFSAKLEEHYREAQDIEFTVQDGTLYVLQTRTAKRTAEAAFRIAHDMVLEKLISRSEAFARVTADQYRSLLRMQVSPEFKVEPHLTGIAASPGVVKGVAVFREEDIAVYGGKSPVILIRRETAPEDFPAMVQSAAILTATGGATSHAAVVARGINKPAVVGALDLVIHSDWAQIERNGVVVAKVGRGDPVTLDGSTGQVWVSVDVPLVGGTVSPEAEKLVAWATAEARALRVITVVDGAPLPASGNYYLSMAGLHKPAEFRALLKRLVQYPELHGILGFRRVQQALAPEDLEFLSLLALSNPKTGESTEAQVVALVKALSSSLLPKKLRKRWTVHLPETVSNMQIDTVLDSEWSIVRPIRVLADLLLANGMVTFAADFCQRMTQEQAKLEDILSVLHKAGRNIVELGPLVEEKALVDEVLGKC